MEEELLKRNTDCVYFLASPLTCKKGVECEYRHSEVARLNPRDCWYWLSGNCLNPTCAFRHPPLDAGSEPPSESASHPQFSEPVNKTNVPCYFFFNGFCNKGDRCSFLHGPDGNNSARESCKTASAVTDAPPLETKTYVASGTATVPIEVPASSSQPASKTLVELQYQHKENLQASAPNNVSGESSSPQRSESQSEEDEEVRPEFLLPAEGFIHNRSLPSTDQSSEDPLDSHSEPDERWESSPGFDVLVDNKSGGLGYEDDSEYRLASDRDHGELKSHLLNHDYDLEYDSAYMNSQIPYESGMCDFDGHLDNEHVPDYGCVLTGPAREKKFNPVMSRKRKFLPRDVVVNGRNCMDLRDHLGKRSVFGSYPVTHISERRISSRLISRIHERPRRHGPRGLHGRLVSKVERNLIESLGEMEDRPNRGKQRAGFRRLEINRSRQHYKGKRLAKERFLSSEVSKEQVSRKRRSIQDSSSFSGPKTLAQILEEKRKAREDGDCFGKRGHISRKSSENFQGPKPLKEILKDKKES